jgi:hypothetical protein
MIEADLVWIGQHQTGFDHESESSTGTRSGAGQNRGGARTTEAARERDTTAAGWPESLASSIQTGSA